jgi:putative oxidoreductase
MKLLLTAVRAWRKIEPYLQCFTLLFIRVMIGWLFFGTGRGKLAHLDKTTAFFADLGLPAPAFHATLVGSLEKFGGLMIVAGLLTRLVSFPLLITMVVAYMTAHREDAFQSISDFADQTPFPYLLGLMVLLAFGPGRVSLDCFIWKRLLPANK